MPHAAYINTIALTINSGPNDDRKKHTIAASPSGQQIGACVRVKRGIRRMHIDPSSETSAQQRAHTHTSIKVLLGLYQIHSAHNLYARETWRTGAECVTACGIRAAHHVFGARITLGRAQKFPEFGACVRASASECE